MIPVIEFILNWVFMPIFYIGYAAWKAVTHVLRHPLVVAVAGLVIGTIILNALGYIEFK